MSMVGDDNRSVPQRRSGETVVVVGAGPRAINLLEWMDRLLSTETPEVQEVVLIDPHGAPGAVWATDQSPHLLMNTLACQSSVLADPSVAEEGPHGPTLFEWARAQASSDGDLGFQAAVAADSMPMPDWVRAECGRLRPDSYAPRRLFGVYLQWALHELASRLALRCTVRLVRDTVIDIRERADGPVAVLASGGIVHGTRFVLAVGHTRVEENPEQRRLRTQTGLTYGSPDHPTRAPIERIPAHTPTLLRGMALNFYDVLAMLTEGRGGRYVHTADGLRYEPSGAEPILYVGSRRGIPQYSRIDKGLVAPEPTVLTNDVVRELIARGGAVDASADLYPLLNQEALAAYYRRVGQLRPEPEHAGWEDLADRVAITQFGTDAWDSLMGSVDPTLRIRSLRELAEPLSDENFMTQTDLDDWMVSFLDRDVARAQDPQQHASAVIPVILRDARWRLQALFESGGVSGESFQRDVDGWFGDLLRTIGNGPPAVRTAQLAALIRSGVAHPMGAGTRLEAHGDGVAARSRTLADAAIPVSAVIDCWVPRQDLRRSADPLLIALRDRGMVRTAWRSNGPGREATELGAIAIDLDTGVAESECATSGIRGRIFVAGVPTEGMRWNTALAGRPGVGSKFFIEMRQIATAVLTAAQDTQGASPVGSRP